MRLLFRMLARLPLPLNHALGALVGRLVFRLSPRYRHRLLDNVRESRVVPAADTMRLARANAAEIGKGATEMAWALFRAEDAVARVTERTGWETVERLRREGRPILFVTPHLGSYDIAGRYLWKHLPILAMYRPHKIGWIDALLREGRNRGAAPDGTNVAPATMAGVRMVLKHLRRGGCTVLLPDQVPGRGEGEWVEFFGRPAYTMTLAARLVQQTGAALLLIWGERLPGGQGFVVHVLPAPEIAKEASAEDAATTINTAMESVIRRAPGQYMWGYHRYKEPRGLDIGAAPPGSSDS